LSLAGDIAHTYSTVGGAIKTDIKIGREMRSAGKAAYKKSRISGASRKTARKMKKLAKTKVRVAGGKRGGRYLLKRASERPGAYSKSFKSSAKRLAKTSSYD
jgi:hypothetical protein